MLLLLCLLSTLAVATGHYPDLKSCHAACDKTQACGEGVACKCDCCGAYGEDVDGCYCLAWCVPSEVLCVFDGRRLASVAFGRVARVDLSLASVCDVPKPNESLVEREPESEVPAGRA